MFQTCSMCTISMYSKRVKGIKKNIRMKKDEFFKINVLITLQIS